MTKMQRVLATLKGQETDRVPFSAYVHSTVHQRTPQKFAEFTLEFYRKYDPDYVKVMYDELYDMPVNFFHVSEVEVWKLLERFDPHIGAFGRQIESLKRIKDSVGADVPVIQTVFSPFHIAYRLAGHRILADWKQDPEAVRHGLDMIAANSAAFAETCVAEAGIDGFFYGAFGCEKEWMSRDQFKAMVMPSDLAVLNTLSRSPISIVHIHSEKDSYFDLLIDYPCGGISWEDRQAGPAVAEARKRTDKCLVGGIDHYLALKCPPEQIVAQGREAIQAAGGRGLILAPGCTFFDGTPEANMLALKEAVGA
jgi:uroporphyrinogen decarboxylase